MKNTANYPTAKEEEHRYLMHNNDPEHEGYQRFVMPMVSGIRNDFTPADRGIDYGSGGSGIIGYLLRKEGFNVKAFDPIFCNNSELLAQTYSYIACCEVIEHFHNPAKEFELLRNILVPGGYLYCMTDLYNNQIDFKKWYYKDDSTHVFFYSLDTFEWIKKTFGFNSLMVTGRLVKFGG